MASYEKILSELLKRNANIDVRPGTVMSDLAYAIGASSDAQASDIDHVALIQSLENADDFTDEEMNNMASNFSITRLPASKSTCVVVFYRASYTASAISIPSGTVTYTSNPRVDFVTTEDASVAANGLASYYSYANERYEIPVSVESADTGSQTRVSTHTIVNINGSVANIDGVDNLVLAEGGRDDETNVAMASRIKAKITNNIGTEGGYEALVGSQPGVDSVYVATAGDTFMLRDENFGGKVDIYVKGSDSTSATDNIVYAGQASMVLEHQPAKSVSSVIGSIASNLTYTFATPTDYIFTEDASSVYTGSEDAQGRVEWESGVKPDSATTVHVLYTYNALPGTLQNVIDDSSNHIVNADVLVKEASSVAIDVTATIAVLPSYSKSSVANSVRIAVEDALDSYDLGEDVEASDILAVMIAVTGVDRVNLPLAKFAKSTEDMVSNVITIDGLNYAVAGTISIG